jgi:hypothetical protein
MRRFMHGSIIALGLVLALQQPSFAQAPAAAVTELRSGLEQAKLAGVVSAALRQIPVMTGSQITKYTRPSVRTLVILGVTCSPVANLNSASVRNSSRK